MNLCSIAALALMSFLLTAGVHSNKGAVVQSPLSADLVEGEAVTLECNIDSPGPKTYKWLKNDLPIPQAIPMYAERVTGNSPTSDNPLLINLRIRNLTECDSGTYYCVMEKLGNQFKGGGTKLGVRRVSQEKHCPPNIVHIAAAAAVVLVLCTALTVVSVLLRQRSKACIALQRQFVAYITEKSAESVPPKQKGKHTHREGKTSSSGQEGKKKKRKPKEHHSVENADYVHCGRNQDMRT
uniref:Natural cytotoxicity triggering receptor 3 n=1 Tax=Ginglymostoma cirratum TaxID=7801 RepID=A0A8A9WR54_GINCI|nr:natural cytotoxicity triggering receptor 3 [Ginglymostoma cirratum]